VRAWGHLRLPESGGQAIAAPVLIGGLPGFLHRLPGGRQLQPVSVFPFLRRRALSREQKQD
jgi:hypothetical protein